MKEFIKKLLREGLGGCDNLFSNESDSRVHNIAISKDLYYYVIKQIKVTLEHMSPDEYFDEIGGFEHHKDLIDMDTVNKKMNDIKNGIKLDIPYLMYNEYGDNVGHEGRHRTIAVKNLGCKTIPVMVERRIKDSDVMELANKLGDLETDDMIVELKKLGFKSFNNIDRISYILRISKEKGRIVIS